MSVYKRTKDSPYYDYDFVFRGDRFCGSCETANRRAAEKVEEGRRAEVKAEYECRKRAAGTALTVDGALSQVLGRGRKVSQALRSKPCGR
jgi:hypothetical protein